MRLWPDLESDAEMGRSESRFGDGRWPVVAYLLERGQWLCAVVCGLAYLSGEGMGYSFWTGILGSSGTAALLNALEDYLGYFGGGGLLLAWLSLLLFARGGLFKCLLWVLLLVLWIAMPSHGVA